MPPASSAQEYFNLHLRTFYQVAVGNLYAYAFVFFLNHRISNPKEFTSSGIFLFTLKYLGIVMLILFICHPMH